jgi:hypothetical protein
MKIKSCCAKQLTYFVTFDGHCLANHDPRGFLPPVIQPQSQPE